MAGSRNRTRNEAPETKQWETINNFSSETTRMDPRANNESDLTEAVATGERRDVKTLQKQKQQERVSMTPFPFCPSVSLVVLMISSKDPGKRGGE